MTACCGDHSHTHTTALVSVGRAPILCATAYVTFVLNVKICCKNVLHICQKCNYLLLLFSLKKIRVCLIYSSKQGALEKIELVVDYFEENDVSDGRLGAEVEAEDKLFRHVIDPYLRCGINMMQRFKGVTGQITRAKGGICLLYTSRCV